MLLLQAKLVENGLRKPEQESRINSKERVSPVSAAKAKHIIQKEKRFLTIGSPENFAKRMSIEGTNKIYKTTPASISYPSRNSPPPLHEKIWSVNDRISAFEPGELEFEDELICDIKALRVKIRKRKQKLRIEQKKNVPQEATPKLKRNKGRLFESNIRKYSNYQLKKVKRDFALSLTVTPKKRLSNEPAIMLQMRSRSNKRANSAKITCFNTGI